RGWIAVGKKVRGQAVETLLDARAAGVERRAQADAMDLGVRRDGGREHRDPERAAELTREVDEPRGLLRVRGARASEGAVVAGAGAPRGGWGGSGRARPGRGSRGAKAAKSRTR